MESPKDRLPPFGQNPGDDVRGEMPADWHDIHNIHSFAFQSDGEAELVDLLRRQGKLQCSMVAQMGETRRVVGSVISTTVEVDGRESLCLEGIGPIGVLPAYQGRGVGSALMVELRTLAYDRSVDALVLLGAPSYYSRFGFVPGSTYGLRCKWTDGPAFQILELRSGSLGAASGVVRYDPAFDALD